MSVLYPSSAWFTFHLYAGEDWQRVVVPQNAAAVTQPVVQAKMEVKNAQRVLVMTLDSTVSPSPAIVIQNDGSLLLHLTTAQTRQFGVGFPGVVQSVSYWGIGRAYLYDLFVKYGSTSNPWTLLLHGTIQVTPGITMDLT